MTTTGLCLWSSDGEGTCFADNVDSFLLVHSFHRSLSDPASLPRWNSFGIWKVRYGACACARACLLFLRRDGCREKTLHPQSERDKCLSGKVSMSATVCVCLCGHMRERERVVFPHGRLSLGIASTTEKLSFLLSIRRELSLYFGPNHIQRKPQENATLEFLNRGSDQFVLT